MADIVVLYHASCTDGAGSMWSAWKFFKDGAKYIAVGKFSKKQSKMLNQCKKAKEVYMCDMMLDMENIEMLAKRGITVWLLDHHISNINEIAAYPFSDEAKDNIKDFCDISRSGAGITWDHFHGGSRPVCIDYIEDSDLWKWKLPDGHSVHTFFSQFNWKSNNDIIERFNEIEQLSSSELIAKGDSLIEYRDKLIDRSLSQVCRAEIFGHNVPILNSNYFLSETANIMAVDEPFAAIWRQSKEGDIRMILRSEQNGLDVQLLAGKLGEKGGGHYHAAGIVFRSYSDMLKQVKFL